MGVNLGRSPAEHRIPSPELFGGERNETISPQQLEGSSKEGGAVAAVGFLIRLSSTHLSLSQAASSRKLS